MKYFIEFGGQKFETDKLGYLKDQQKWSAELAEHIAQLENLSMDEPRWEVVNFVRQFYQQFDTSPAIRLLVKSMGQSLGPDKGNSRYLHRLFPGGPAKQACKIAGLPKPKKCL